MPFLALLGAAISNLGHESDRKLLDHVIASLKQAGQIVPGAKKLYDVCHVLHSTALKTIDAAKAHEDGSHTTVNMNRYNRRSDLRKQWEGQAHKDLSNENPSKVAYGSAAANKVAFTAGANPQSTLSMSDNSNEISTWFENYMEGNTSLLDMLNMDEPQTILDWATF